MAVNILGAGVPQFVVPRIPNAILRTYDYICIIRPIIGINAEHCSGHCNAELAGRDGRLVEGRLEFLILIASIGQGYECPCSPTTTLPSALMLMLG